MNTADLTMEHEYRAFAALVRMRAKLFPKNHGNWAALPLSDNRFLSMDTWNGNIILKRGPVPECDYWVGFRDAETIANIGLLSGGNFKMYDIGTMRDVMRELTR